MKNDILKEYLKMAASSDTLSFKEKMDILQSIKDGNYQLRDKFIMSYVKMVIDIAQTFYIKSGDINDLIELGMIGLIKGVDKISVSRIKSNTQINSYIYSAIRNNIINSIELYGDVISYPRDFYSLCIKVANKEEEFIAENSRTPSDEELSDALGIDVKKVGYVRGHNPGNVVIPNDEDENAMPSDFSTTEMVMMNERNETLKSIINMLDEDEKYIICSYYGLCNVPQSSVEDVAKDFNLTTSAIYFKRKEAESKMRNFYIENGFKKEDALEVVVNG